MSVEKKHLTVNKFVRTMQEVTPVFVIKDTH